MAYLVLILVFGAIWLWVVARIERDDVFISILSVFCVFGVGLVIHGMTDPEIAPAEQQTTAPTIMDEDHQMQYDMLGEGD